MKNQVGYFENGRLYLNLEVSGNLPQGKKIIKAQIDTGYDGHLSLPFSEAFPLGLTLIGTRAYIIADGSTITNFSCVGNITVNGKTETMDIDIIPNGGILMGMSLLQKFGNNCHIDFKKKIIEFV